MSINSIKRLDNKLKQWEIDELIKILITDNNADIMDCLEEMA